MTYSKQRLREVTALKREAVRRIQSDIDEIDASPSRKYIQEFNREFHDFDSVCEPAEVFEQAQESNLIWVGDYHALTRSQTYAMKFVRDLAAQKKNNVAVAVEPVFGRNQQVLDEWMAGKISEQEFLDRIHYYEEWGCEWEGYKAIFTAARELRIPVYGVDCHPRNDMRSIGRRDLGVARRIARLMETNPERTLIVIFGESHLAGNHAEFSRERESPRENCSSFKTSMRCTGNFRNPDMVKGEPFVCATGATACSMRHQLRNTNRSGNTSTSVSRKIHPEIGHCSRTR
jgi:hypothetical protein